MCVILQQQLNISDFHIVAYLVGLSWLQVYVVIKEMFGGT